MKKLMVIGIAVMMMVSVCAVANAAMWYIGVSSATYTQGSQIQFGNSATGTGSFSTPTADADCIAIPTDQTWVPGGTTGTLLAKKLGTGAIDTEWTIAVWAKNALAPNPSTITVWCNATQSADVAGKKYAIYDGSTILGQAFTVDTTKTAQTNSMFKTTITLPVTGDPANQAMKLTFKPFVEEPPANTPEPGSIIAMLSGLVGLAGYGIRRRK